MSFKVDTKGSMKEETPLVVLPQKREDIYNPFKSEFNLATQQEDIVLAVPDNEVIAIDSCAGSSKTVSQVVMAHNHKVPSLYLTFSKLLAVEAEEMFPFHVECRTIHSLAYREKGADIAHKLTRPRGRYRNVAGTGSEIAKFYKIEDIIVDREHSIKNTLIGLMVKQAIAKYEASSEEFIGKDCLPYDLINTTKNKYPHIPKSLWKEIERELHREVLKYTNKLWIDRQDSTSEVLASHDTYVKMWALTNPTINTEVLYLDEIQDASMVFMGVVQQQVGKCRIVLVGDPDQNLYQWRHSVNGLALVDAKQMKLSQSFRYGQSAADLAEIILDNGRKITGNPEINTVVGFEGIIDTSKHYVKLFRNNATLIQEAVLAISDGLKANIHVDVQDYVKMLESAEALFFGDIIKVKHEEILPFDNWEEFKDEAKNGGVLARVYSTVNGGDTKKIINLLRSHENTDNPDITLMTNHKAKGKTFDWVMLADDFESNYNKAGEWIGISEEERRLLYVGVTRGKLGTEYNTTVKELVEKYEARRG